MMLIEFVIHCSMGVKGDPMNFIENGMERITMEENTMRNGGQEYDKVSEYVQFFDLYILYSLFVIELFRVKIS